jgi:hypothetical protein
MYEDYLEYLFKYSLNLLLKRRKNSKSPRKEQSSAVQDDDNCKTDATALTEDSDVDDKTEDNAETLTEIQQNGVPDTDAQNMADASPTDETAEGTASANDYSTKRSEEHTVRSSSDAEVVSKSNDDTEYSFSELHFNFTLFLLWLSVTLLNVPCVLVWAHNYR